MLKPTIDPSVFIAKDAVILGNVSIAKDCSIWYHAVLRSIEAPITIGHSSNVQDNAVIHVDHDHPVSIGSYVTIGHGAIIHGCSVGDNSLIGMGAILLNGSKIGKNCIIGAGALIPQNKIIPDNSLVIGAPGKVVRQVTAEEIAQNRQNAKSYVDERITYAVLDQLGGTEGAL